MPDFAARYKSGAVNTGRWGQPMRLTHERWLDEQLPVWEREGIVTAEGAQRLRERYPAKPQTSLAQTLVGGVGALLIGNGLIAVLAYNWDDFPRWVRLVLALGPLAATQAVSWWVLLKDETAKPWQREAAALAQTLAVGAALALVSQIYNLPGTWTELVFWWCVVSVPLAWVLRSQAVAIAYLLGITCWTIAQTAERAVDGLGEAADVRFWYPLLLAGIVPLWPGLDLRERPAVGSRFVLAASTLIGLCAVGGYAAIQPTDPSPAFYWLAMLSAAVVMLCPLDREGIAEPIDRKPQVLLGGIVLVSMALISTYEDPARELAWSVFPALASSWCWLLLAVVMVFAGIAFRQGRVAVLAVAALGLVPLLTAPLATVRAGGWPVAITYSLVLLATGVLLIALEFFGRQGAARIGAFLITLLVIMRMVDAELSLLAKGLAFIVIGSGFLAFNAYVTIRRVTTTKGSPA
jgi:hypothetical protein